MEQYKCVRSFGALKKGEIVEAKVGWASFGKDLEIKKPIYSITTKEDGIKRTKYWMHESDFKKSFKRVRK